MKGDAIPMFYYNNNNNNNNKSLFQANHRRQRRPIFKIQYTYDTNIDQIQIHNTDPNVCRMNSKKNR